MHKDFVRNKIGGGKNHFCKEYGTDGYIDLAFHLKITTKLSNKNTFLLRIMPPNIHLKDCPSKTNRGQKYAQRTDIHSEMGCWAFLFILKGRHLGLCQKPFGTS
jgi:hypothetical protein